MLPKPMICFLGKEVRDMLFRSQMVIHCSTCPGINMVFLTYANWNLNISSKASAVIRSGYDLAILAILAPSMTKQGLYHLSLPWM